MLWLIQTSRFYHQFSIIQNLSPPFINAREQEFEFDEYLFTEEYHGIINGTDKFHLFKLS